MIVSLTSPRRWMKPTPPLPLIAFEPPVPLMIQVSPPAAVVPTSWSLPVLPTSSTLPVPPLARKAVEPSDGAQSTWSLLSEVTDVPVLQDSGVVIAESVYHGKKLTSADTEEPVPKLQWPGPVGAPHQSFFAVATEVLSFSRPPALVVPRLLVATVSFGALSPAVWSEATRMASSL